jgi:hypothetical protein
MLDDNEILAEAEKYVRTFAEPLPEPKPFVPQTAVIPQWVHAHSAVGGISFTEFQTVRFGACVAIKSLISAAYPPLLAVQILTTAIGLAKGGLAHWMPFSDAALLDWCWRNCSTRGLIHIDEIKRAAVEIGEQYGLENFDETKAIGCMEALIRNGCVEDWEQGTYKLCEEVTIWWGE